MGQPQTRLKELLNFLISLRVRETLELNQLKSAPSQLLPFFQDLTGCKLVAIHLDWQISSLFFLFK